MSASLYMKGERNGKEKPPLTSPVEAKGGKLKIEGKCDTPIKPKQDFVLHPLIYTPLQFRLAQDMEKKKSGARDSAFS